MKQRTILNPESITGVGLHSASRVKLTIKPAAPDTGIVFKRTDIFGAPEVKPDITHISQDLVRNTGLTCGHVQLHTVEHVLSALSGMGIDNCIVELDASEPPILDGSARGFVELIEKAQPVEQDAERKYFVLRQPISVSDGNKSVVALPYDGLKVTFTFADDRGLFTQHLSIEIDPDNYRDFLAPARTFTTYEDIEPLLKIGKIQGGSLDCAIVIKGDKIIAKEPLRFPDEFVRHKILDVVGDLALLGMPLKAHIVEVRSGHALNAKLTAKIYEQMQALKKAVSEGKPEAPAVPAQPKVKIFTETTLDTRRILELVPHRYPFLMVDRVAEVKDKTEITAIKNVTITEPFFQGHFPGNPVMPGVLQLEAMAQTAGILTLWQNCGENKLAFFMSADKVKFRRAVKPGDQLVITAKIIQRREGRESTVVAANVECRVADKVVSSAELKFAVMNAADAP